MVDTDTGCPVTITFFKIESYRLAIMNEGIAEVYEYYNDILRTMHAGNGPEIIVGTFPFFELFRFSCANLPGIDFPAKELG